MLQTQEINDYFEIMHEFVLKISSKNTNPTGISNNLKELQKNCILK